MHPIDYLYMSEASFEPDLIRCIKEKVAVKSTGYCIVENRTKDPDAFMFSLHEHLAPSLSLSQKGGIAIPYDVVQDKGAQMNNPGSILSSTNRFFPLHTDCCFLEKPADLIALYCLENSNQGGESILLNINNVIPLFTRSELDHLLRPAFQFYSKKYPILEIQADTFLIRFHEGELAESFMPTIEEPELKLEPLISVLNNPAFYTTVKIRKHQCLIVNNRTCLHGRFAFEAGSRRTFYRSRHYLC